MYNLYSVFAECKKNLVNMGIPVAKAISIEPNYRAKKRYGQCVRKPNGTYSININVDLLKEVNPINALKGTVYHELLHTCPNCMNHGEQWSTYASIVNQTYGVTVKRCSSAAEKGLVEFRQAEEHYKYIITCTSCGKQYGYQRAGKAVKHPGNYRCPCGGKLVMATD